MKKTLIETYNFLLHKVCLIRKYAVLQILNTSLDFCSWYICIIAFPFVNAELKNYLDFPYAPFLHE